MLDICGCPLVGNHLEDCPTMWCPTCEFNYAHALPTLCVRHAYIRSGGRRVTSVRVQGGLL